MNFYDTPANEQEGRHGENEIKKIRWPKKLNQSEISPHDKARFEAKIAKAGPDDCWPWTAYRNRSGYGKFGLNGVAWVAHRVAYVIYKGDIAEKVLARHSCDNPACCNPNHLFAGTYMDNYNDMVLRGRSNRCKGKSHRHYGKDWSIFKGDLHGRRKLNSSQVAEIRELLISSKYHQREVAKIYGITQSLVSMIFTKRIWNSE